MRTSLWICRACQRETQNYRKCPRCHGRAELAFYELVEVQPDANDQYVQVVLVEEKTEVIPSQIPIPLIWRTPCTTDVQNAEPKPNDTGSQPATDGLLTSS